MVVHAEEPVDGDADRERGAEADRVAERMLTRRVRLERSAAGAARVSQPLGSPGAARSAATQTISDQSCLE